MGRKQIVVLTKHYRNLVPYLHAMTSPVDHTQSVAAKATAAFQHETEINLATTWAVPRGTLLSGREPPLSHLSGV